MLSDLNPSKEVIKNRMLRYALNYWSLKNVEDLDPMVKLLMEALALELYNLGNETQDTQVRILEKVAGLLAPDFLTAPQPAHAVLQAQPVEPTEVLPKTAGFTAPLKIAARPNQPGDTSLQAWFTPVDAVPLFDAQLAALATAETLFLYDAATNRQPVARAGRGRHTENNNLWLGLRISAKLDNLNGLAFYFDGKNMERQLAQQVYQLLPLAKWFLGEQELLTTAGLAYAPPARENAVNENLFLRYDAMTLMEKDIKQFYEPKFVSLANNKIPLHEAKAAYPPAFASVFSPNDLQLLTEPLLWLKLVFPASLHPYFLNELQVYPNAFPVMNRQLNDLKYRLKGGSNIIPLRTGAFDQFLSVQTLTDDSHTYRPVPHNKAGEEEWGTYSLRRGGVERFDDRNARELIGYLLEMLRSESAAFAAYGYDFIAGTLKEMNQKISLMEQKTRSQMREGADVPNYILVKPFDGKDMMYAEYWTTLAEAANGLRSGTRLQQGKGVRVKPDSLALLSTTAGGKSRLPPEERLAAFRYGVTTRNRIITKEDIRNFCFYELGNRLQQVTVERGFEVAPGSRDAFVRTIIVTLTPLETESLESKEWDLLCEQLEAKLQARSGMSNRYRIRLQKQ